MGLGFRMAGERLPQIAAWAFLAATVGLLLNMLEERSQWLGKIVAAILGGLWTVATYLVVPTLAVEGLGPIDALKRSTALIRGVWGEGLTGNFSIGAVGFVLSIPALLAIFATVMLQPPIPLMAAIVIIAVVYLIAVAVIISAVKQVFIAGLYVYATEKRVPHGFDRASMSSAFASKS